MTINCKGKILNLDSPIVMGILNITSDSFYDGGTNKTDLKILSKTEQMLSEGASIIDIGGASSKPNAKIVPVEEENHKVLKTLGLILKEFPETITSIDTFHSSIAENAIKNGAAMINDISAGEMDANMFGVIEKYNIPYIIMHMQGTPQNMQNNPTYKDVTKSVIQYLSDKILELKKRGINDIIVDPGFGFGKTIEHNFKLLKELSLLNILDTPILAGISRKSMIYKTLESSPSDALNGTTALNMVALQNGASILRVHDVKEAIETIKLFNQF